MLRSWALRIGWLGAALLFTTFATAQTSAGNKAAAEALFEEGRTLMQQQQYKQACGKLEASQNLDAGLGTLMLLSDCYEKTGRTASAWATFREAAAVARKEGDSERESVARARADALEPNLAKLVIHGPERTLGLAGLHVKMNGQDVAKAQWGTLIPVDPGEVAFEVSAPGYKTWTLNAQVVPGPSQTAIDIPELEALEPEPEGAAGPAQSEANVSETENAVLTVDSGSKDQSAVRTTGVALGVGGAVALGVGTYFGLRAKSKNDDSNQADNCPTEKQCFDTGIDLRDQARSAATVSTIAFGLGGALLVAGGVLYFTSPDTPNQEARGELRWRSGVGPDGARFSLEGRW